MLLGKVNSGGKANEVQTNICRLLRMRLETLLGKRTCEI